TNSSGVEKAPIAPYTLSSPMPSLSLNAAILSRTSCDGLYASLILVRLLLFLRGKRVLLLRQHALHFRDRDHWQEAGEQQEQRQEQPDGSDERADIDPGRPEVTPGAGQEVAMQAGDDNHESLEPHSDVHHDRQHEHHRDAAAQLLEPEELR